MQRKQSKTVLETISGVLALGELSRWLFKSVEAASPLVTTSSGTTTYTENQTPVVVDSGVTVTDDNTNLQSARCIIWSYISSDGELAFVNQNGITGSFNSVTGRLDLTGITTVANYQTALRTITYENASEDPIAKTLNIAFTVFDGGASSSIAWKSVNVVPVNDAPVVKISSGNVTYTENQAPVVVDSGIRVSDVDSLDIISSGQVRITNVVSNEDLLASTDQNGISGAYNGSTGVLSLSGNARTFFYEALFRGVTYQDTSETPNVTPRNIEFTVKDALGLGSTPVSRIVNVVELLDVPVITTSAGNITYTENQPPLPIDSTLTVSDVDSANLTSAQVQIANVFPNEDILAFVDQNGISGNYNNTRGILKLLGSSSVANYQTALRNVTYQDTSSTPTTTTRNIEFTANDGDTSSIPVSRWVEVIELSEPVLTISSGNTTYTETQPPVPIDGGLTVTDKDSTNLNSAKVQITNVFPNEDILAFVDQNGIAGNYNNTQGILKLLGSSSVGNYQTALRSVTYHDTSNTPTTTTRNIEFTVNDGSGSSIPVTREVTVVELNEPVVTISSGNSTYIENQAPVVIDSGLTVTDIDNANLSSAQIRITNFVSGEDMLGFVNQNGIVGNFNSASGILSLTGTSSVANYQTGLRNVTYHDTSENPNPTARNIEFIVNDGIVASSPVLREVMLVQVNDAPIIVNPISDQKITIDAPFSFSIGDAFIDPDGDQLTFKASGDNNQPLPAGVEFDAITKSFSGKISEIGNYSLTVTARDPFNLQVSDPFTINAEEPGLNIPLIAGVTGGIVGVALLGLFGYFGYRQCRKEGQPNDVELSPPEAFL